MKIYFKSKILSVIFIFIIFSYKEGFSYFQEDYSLGNNNDTFFNVFQNLQFNDFEYSDSITNFGIFSSIIDSDKSILYYDIKSSFFNNSSIKNLSTGLGLRFQKNDKNIIGLNSYIDYFSIPNSIISNLYRSSFGFEFINKKFEIKTNLYFNLNESYRQKIESNLNDDLMTFNKLEIVENKMFVEFVHPEGTFIKKNEFTSFNKFDFEFGYLLNKNIVLHLGGFGLWLDDEKIFGSKIKLSGSFDITPNINLYGKVELFSELPNIQNLFSKNALEISTSLRYNIGNNNNKKSKTNPLLKSQIMRDSYPSIKKTTEFIDVNIIRSEIKKIGDKEIDYFISVENKDNFDNITKDEGVDNIAVFFNLNSNNSLDADINSANIDFTKKNLLIFGNTSQTLNFNNPNNFYRQGCLNITSRCFQRDGLPVFKMEDDLLKTYHISINSNNSEEVKFNFNQNTDLKFNSLDWIGGKFINITVPATNIDLNFSGNTVNLLSINQESGLNNVIDDASEFNIKNSKLKNSNIISNKKINNLILENNLFDNTKDKAKILDIMMPKNILIKNNYFLGDATQSINIKNNDKYSFALDFFNSINYINGESTDGTTDANKSINYISFESPIIPPLFNDQITNTVYPSVLLYGNSPVFDLSSDTSYRYNFAQSISENWENFDPNIQITEKNLIQILSAPNEKNIYFPENSDIIAINKLYNMNLDYKIFTTDTNRNNHNNFKSIYAGNINEAVIFNEKTLNFNNSNRISGIDFNNSTLNLYEKENILFQKNIFNDSEINIKETTSNESDFSKINIRTDGHVFFENQFNLSANAKNFNMINYSLENTNHILSSKFSQFDGSLKLKNNKFSIHDNAKDKNNNFIYIKPNKNIVINNKSFDQSFISKDIQEQIKYFYKGNNEFSYEGSSDKSDLDFNSKILTIESKNILEFINSDKQIPFTAYFQFDPYTRSGNFKNPKYDDNLDSKDIIFNQVNIDFNFLGDYSLQNMYVKDPAEYNNFSSPTSPIYPISTGNLTNIFLKKDVSSSPGTNLEFLGKQPTYKINNNIWGFSGNTITIQKYDGTTEYKSDRLTIFGNSSPYVTNMRISGWKDFDRLIKVDISDNDNLGEKIRKAKEGFSGDSSKKYLFLLNNPSGRSIEITLDSGENLLNDDEYIIGADYKFWISKENNAYNFVGGSSNANALGINQYHNEIINLNNNEFDINKIKINVALESAGSSQGFKPIILNKKDIGILGLNFNINFDGNSNLLLDYPKAGIIGGSSGISFDEYHFKKKNNSLFSFDYDADDLKLFQDNQFKIKKSDNDNSKDYINIFNFRKDDKSTPFKNGNSDFIIPGTSTTVPQASSLNYYKMRYKIYNNKFDFTEAKKVHAANIYYSFAALFKNYLIADQNFSSEIDLVNIQNIATLPLNKGDVGSYTAGSSVSASSLLCQYNFFSDKNMQKIPHNNILTLIRGSTQESYISSRFKGFESSDYMNGLSDFFDKIFKNNISLVSIENPNHTLKDSSSLNKINRYYINGFKYDEVGTTDPIINFLHYPVKKISSLNDHINILSNATSEKFTVGGSSGFSSKIMNFPSIALTGNGSILNIANSSKSPIIIASTNNKQKELSVDFVNQFGNTTTSSSGSIINYTAFVNPHRYIFNSIDTIMNISPSSPYNSDDLSLGLSNNTIFNFSGNSQKRIGIIGLDIKAFKNYNFSAPSGVSGCGTLNNSGDFISTCSSCLNPSVSTRNNNNITKSNGCNNCINTRSSCLTENISLSGDTLYIFNSINTTGNSHRIENSLIDINHSGGPSEMKFSSNTNIETIGS